MILTNIKEEVKALEEAGNAYETQVTPFFDGDTLTHKHIFIPALEKHYVFTNDLQWYTGECDICK